MNQEGTTTRLRTHRATRNTAYHANLGNLERWLPYHDDLAPMDHHLTSEIRAMLSLEPGRRPVSPDLLRRLTYYDNMSVRQHDTYSIFGSCCRTTYIAEEEHKEKVHDWRADYRKKELALMQSERQVKQLQTELRQYKADLRSAESRIEQEKRKDSKENEAIRSAGENQQTDHFERDLTASLVRDLKLENQILLATLGKERDKMAAKETRDRLRKMNTKRLERKPKDNRWNENPTDRDNETYARSSVWDSVSSSDSEAQEDSTPNMLVRLPAERRSHTVYSEGRRSTRVEPPKRSLASRLKAALS